MAKLTLFTKTFTHNEYSSILGKKRMNFIILLVVFFFSLAALEFSRSGTKYLEYKMSDPFINWIDIRKIDNRFVEFMDEVHRDEVRARYSIGEVESNHFMVPYVFDRNYNKIRVDGRTFAPSSRLVEKILEPENVVYSRSGDIKPDDYGWIITLDLLKRMGYSEDSIPLYAGYSRDVTVADASAWGLKYQEGGFIEIPVPIIAVVRQLPNLLDFLAPCFFYEQEQAENNPFALTLHREYYNDLYFVMEDTASSYQNIAGTLKSAGVPFEEYFEYERNDRTLHNSWTVKTVVYDSVVGNVNAVAEKILEKNPEYYRVYKYEFQEGRITTPDYLSLMFNDISTVSAFASWAKEVYGIRIDMAQIEAKNNFNTFNVLSNVLCMAIVILSVLFVMIFLWFLIDSHFRSISRNLGTIMAFGLPNRTIVQIYLRVFLRMVCTSLLISVASLVAIELLMSLFGLVREGGFHYISTIDGWVICMIVVIPLMTAAVVAFTVHRKLRAKPGDLIFDRFE